MVGAGLTVRLAIRGFDEPIRRGLQFASAGYIIEDVGPSAGPTLERARERTRRSGAWGEARSGRPENGGDGSLRRAPARRAAPRETHGQGGAKRPSKDEFGGFSSKMPLFNNA